jgi:hypothetical protein
VTVPVAVVRDVGAVQGDVSLELSHGLQELPAAIPWRRQEVEVVIEIVEDLQGPRDVPVLQEPLHALKLGGCFGCVDRGTLFRIVGWRRGGLVALQPIGQLPQYDEPHRDVEPVEPMLRLGAEIVGHLPHVIGPIGEERDLLVNLEALRLQQLEEAPLRLGVLVLRIGEALAGAIRGEALPRDHFEPALVAGRLVLRMDEAPPSSPTVSGVLGDGSASQSR